MEVIDDTVMKKPHSTIDFYTRIAVAPVRIAVAPVRCAGLTVRIAGPT